MIQKYSVILVILLTILFSCKKEEEPVTPAINDNAYGYLEGTIFPPKAAAKIELYSQANTFTASTDQNGKYIFKSLTPGSYSLRFTPVPEFKKPKDQFVSISIDSVKLKPVQFIPNSKIQGTGTITGWTDPINFASDTVQYDLYSESKDGTKPAYTIIAVDTNPTNGQVILKTGNLFIYFVNNSFHGTGTYNVGNQVQFYYMQNDKFASTQYEWSALSWTGSGSLTVTTYNPQTHLGSGTFSFHGTKWRFGNDIDYNGSFSNVMFP